MTVISEVRKLFGRGRRGARAARRPVVVDDGRLLQLRGEVWERGWGEVVTFDGLTVRVTDGPNFYMQYKDEFVQGVYHFDATRRNPRILDGGANIGMSALCWKRTYPAAEIVSFEPDPAVFTLLQENLAANGLTGVELVNAGLGPRAGRFAFNPDQSAGGQIELVESAEGVRVEKLSDYLHERVDLLKLNIEGLELDVLREAADAGRLRNIDEIVLEYHGWPGQPQRLGELLVLLEREGFRYLLHDFDAETCAATKPPFHLQRGTTWFCLVYAKRDDLVRKDR
ncbi:MAG: FkbM family methyltransferase [Pirellulaceae bacterium]